MGRAITGAEAVAIAILGSQICIRDWLQRCCSWQVQMGDDALSPHIIRGRPKFCQGLARSGMPVPDAVFHPLECMRCSVSDESISRPLLIVSPIAISCFECQRQLCILPASRKVGHGSKVGFKRPLPLIIGIDFHMKQRCSLICSISFLTCDGTRLTLPLWYFILLWAVPVLRSMPLQAYILPMRLKFYIGAWNPPLVVFCGYICQDPLLVRCFMPLEAIEGSRKRIYNNMLEDILQDFLETLTHLRMRTWVESPVDLNITYKRTCSVNSENAKGSGVGTTIIC
ncbi:uncharacterized protein BO87DRAFT_419098 [Aspergillus neoniger CBS 115656]|uniref:Uncharacterized protein n=1 Tax=Aspergillus neoniger (strain CBS 115656) TaxID=1448310 RepID=A0A318Y780_ASPNB|nr:hypothetical protein BO87DRAFT_419098 [Aspergillus neoniger CBS 115656]PYH30156.1 hypothetical protein BO87DRAFT_419098 [Aspergillus neoniger CBS 115656]